MKKTFLLKNVLLILSITLGSGSAKLHGMCGGAPVNWHNLSNCATATGRINNNVTDRNIDIQGINSVFGPKHITANTCDIVISVTSGDSVITGCDASSRLYLSAAAGRTITFNLSDNLAFVGGPLASQTLLVTFSGAGELIFNIDGGETLTFGNDPADGYNGFAVFYEIMNNMGAVPTVTIQRTAVNPSVDSIVTIGTGSVISFAAASAANLGTLIIDPTQTGAGQLVLNILGGLDIGAHSLTVLVDPLVTDIGPILPGAAPELSLINSNIIGAASSFLRIINSNSACPRYLADPFCNGPATGFRPGFILGPSGVLVVNDMTYIDYIGTATNICCTFTTLDECGNVIIDSRLRNGSAFIVDGDPANATTSSIIMNGSSAIYFRSGVDNCGVVSADFIISPSLQTPCAGNIVFDIEGQLNIVGDPFGNNAINVLSLQVAPVGCGVFVESPETVFPARTFARDANGAYLQYNAGAILVNNRVNIFDAAIVHSDSIHHVFPEGNAGRSDLQSEPTYIGGDSYLLPCKSGILGRPTIAFYNSQLRVNTDIAFNGVDLLVGNLPAGNESQFIFYNNGRCIDNGYGRNMILGTGECFESCSTTTDSAAHLNIFQETAAGAGASAVQNLRLLVAPNSNCITEGIISPATIANQFAVQTIYLNNATNISIGTLGTPPFALVTHPQLLIDGPGFSFETKGGLMAYPEASGTTGQGGIFVDTNGAIRDLHNYIANFGTMVVKSGNGIVDLPENSVFFDTRVGITEWDINLTNPANLVLVAPGETLSDYTMDWGAVVKDCSNIPGVGFIPYDLPATPAPCNFQMVTAQNLTNLPTIQGVVQQMQIKRSRIMNQAHLKVDGGFIRELVLLDGYDSAEAAVGFIVLQNHGHVGIGSAHKDVDSLDASVKLGVNGLMLVANGDGSVEINSDVLIDNVCHILTGTSFGATGPQTLELYSLTPKELRVKSTGVLDLTAFTNTNQILAIGGQLYLVMEPGSRIIMNGGVLIFTDESRFFLEPNLRTGNPTGTAVTSTDSIRVKMTGSGTVLMDEGSLMVLPHSTYFGIESDPACSPITNILWLMQDNAQIQIGNDRETGGAFQIGNTTELGASVNFNLVINGIRSGLQISNQGFLGLGVGVADKQSLIPNNWRVGCLFDVNHVGINIVEGLFKHNVIASGDTPFASLLAVGPGTAYDFTFNNPTTVILGGGNIYNLNCVSSTAAVAPAVTNFAGIVSTTPIYQETGIMSSKSLLFDKGGVAGQPVNATRQQLFNYIKTLPADNRVLMPVPKTNVSLQQVLLTPVIAYISQNTLINRRPYLRILSGISADPSNQSGLAELGAAYINLSPITGDIDMVTAIQTS